MQIRFKNPPINELIIGAYLHPPPVSLRSEHIGLLWSRFRDEFPKAEQRQPIFTGLQENVPVMVSGGELFPMPLFWFISEDEANLIQVQKDVFFLNWRKRAGEYPHFDEQLKPCFDEKFAIFKEFLHKDVGVPDVGIGRCELTYVNAIEPCEYWQGPQDTSGLLPSISIPDSGSKAGAVSGFNCTYSYIIEPHLHLQLAIRTTKSINVPNSMCLVLEFRAFGQPTSSAKSDVDRWYKQAHDAIITQFLSVTDRHVQRTFWIREEESE